MLAFQDYYPENVAHCYGCGRLNGQGTRSRPSGKATRPTCYHPPEHTAIPGFVYGGLIASLIDCHGTGTAAAAAYRAENRPMDSEPPALRDRLAARRLPEAHADGPGARDARPRQGDQGSQGDRRGQVWAAK
jgi:hypothetical protein